MTHNIGIAILTMSDVPGEGKSFARCVDYSQPGSNVCVIRADGKGKCSLHAPRQSSRDALAAKSLIGTIESGITSGAVFTITVDMVIKKGDSFNQAQKRKEGQQKAITASKANPNPNPNPSKAGAQESLTKSLSALSISDEGRLCTTTVSVQVV